MLLNWLYRLVSHQALWGGTPPPSGPTNGIFLEDGVSYLLAESGDYLVQE